MTKIVIVDYSLEIVIAIINNIILIRFMPLFEAYFYINIYIKRLKTLFLNFYSFSLALSLKWQLCIGLVSSLNKKRYNYAWYNNYTKTKRKKKKKWFTKAIHFIYN